MKIICIHTLKNEDNKAWRSILKGLKDNEYYFFYKGYKIKDREITISPNEIIDDLYNPSRYAKGKTSARFKVNICAIVGENGSGKSSLIDIYIRLINNLATFVFGEDFIYPKAEHLHFVNGIFAEVYIEIEENIYCICCRDAIIEVSTYERDNDNRNGVYIYKGPIFKSEKIDNTKLCPSHNAYFHILQDLCYNTILNYSIHSYNYTSYQKENTYVKKEIKIRETGFRNGLYRPRFMFDRDNKEIKLTKALLNENFEEGFSWLSGVFHKNDGFQTPLVISPKRDYGMIDINNENKLSEERLLSLLFVEDNNEYGKNRFPFSEINRKLKIEGFTIIPDKNIINHYKKAPSEHPDLPNYTINEYVELRDFVRDKYNGTFNIGNVDRYHREAAINYMVAKTIKIFMTYPRYKDIRTLLIRKKGNDESYENTILPESLERLWTDDHTHVTVKLRRTLNYLRYDHIAKSKSFKIQNLAKAIDCIIEKNNGNRKEAVETDEMLPPPIFNVNFHVYNIDDKDRKHKIPFNTLSSGEKQITYITCSLFYYMLCLDSAHRAPKNNGQVAYRHINIVFDEIELYFHPEMQRIFISTLLHGLQQLPFRYIKTLHFMIVTHSPFVLSDIPSNNILFLKKNGEIDNNNDTVSFGANIHTMLVNSFFLKGGAMGEFAKETISSIIDCVNYRYLYTKKKYEYNDDMERIRNRYKCIFDSLPDSYQKLLKDKDINDTDWCFVRKMASVIQEPIIRTKLKEMIEYVDNKKR